MTKTSTARVSKIETEKHSFNKELVVQLSTLGYIQPVIVHQLQPEPKRGKFLSIINDNATGVKFTNALKLYVENESFEKYSPFKKIYIVNEYVTHIFLEGLNNALNEFATITDLQLKNCNLTIAGIETLHNMLKSCQQIVNLNLDQNPIPEQTYGCLIHETNLKFLSLQQCKINEKGVKCLSRNMICNRKLLVLDLSSNCIDDKGAEYLAALLRQNRKLKCLLLTDNWITDIGCKSIMEALQKFALNKDEIYVKRQLAFKYYQQKRLLLEQIKPSARILSPKSINYPHKTSKTRGHKQTKKSKSPSNKLRLTAVYPKEVNSESDKQIQEYLDEHVPKSNHPFFLSNISIENNNIYCTGNMVLIFLSLAYNKITKLGYNYMIEVLRYQLLQTVAPSRLMYIIINGNFDLNSTEATEVDTLLQEQQFKISNGKSVESRIGHGRLSIP